MNRARKFLSESKLITDPQWKYLDSLGVLVPTTKSSAYQLLDWLKPGSEVDQKRLAQVKAMQDKYLNARVKFSHMIRGEVTGTVQYVRPTLPNDEYGKIPVGVPLLFGKDDKGKNFVRNAGNVEIL